MALLGDYGSHLALELQRSVRAYGMTHLLHAYLETASVGTHSYDIGAVPVAGTHRTLSTVGIGLTLNPQGRYSASLMYAVPIDDSNLPGEDGRAWASVSARF